MLRLAACTEPLRHRGEGPRCCRSWGRSCWRPSPAGCTSRITGSFPTPSCLPRGKPSPRCWRSTSTIPTGDRWEFVDVPPDQAADRRFEFTGSDRLTDPILVPGGRGALPGVLSGPRGLSCGGVRRPRGSPACRGRTAPTSWRNGWRRRTSSPRISRTSTPPGSPFSNMRWIRGVSKYANGDLLVVFQFPSYAPLPRRGGAYRRDRQAGVVPSGLQPPSATPDRWGNGPGSGHAAGRGRSIDIPKLPGRERDLRMTRLEINLDCEELQARSW